MDDLCTACLCSGRNLYYIGETCFYDVYSQILNEIAVYDLSQMCIRICWECHSALRRFQNFKLQVKSCYTEILQYLHEGQQDLKLIQKPPHLHIEQVISVDYPEIKTEFDSLDLNNGGDEPKCFLDLHSEQPVTKNYDQNEFDTTDVDNFVKEEDHNDLETFVNELDLKNKPEKKKRGRKVSKVKTPKEKKKKSKVKKATKVRKKKLKLQAKEIKSDAESCHDFDDNYLSPVEEREEIEEEDKVDVDGKEFESYQKNGLELEMAIPKTMATRNGPANKRKSQTVQLVPKQRSDKVLLSEKPECAECGKVFSSRKTLRYHLNVLHKGNNRYPCPRCGKVYQWKSNLGRHLRSHKARDTGELYCATCDKRFASVATYRQHLSVSKQHVSESEFSFTCNECGKKFVNKTRLRDHIDWEHLQKIKFRCQLCNKPFKCHTSLYVHMKNVHRNKGLKDNLCHVCGKSYQNAAKLRYHIVAMHTTQTPYQCVHCSAAFGWYSSLYRHVREVHYKMKVHPSKTKKSKKRLLETIPPPMMQPHLVLPPPLPQTGMP